MRLSSSLAFPGQHRQGCPQDMLAVYQKALDDLLPCFDEPFQKVLSHLETIKTPLIFSGVGKSGHIAKKLAASFTSTGTPSLFVHPTEAAHGDLGMVQEKATLCILSNSGETQELAPLLSHAKDMNASIIAITAHPQSTLGKAACFVLNVPQSQEICPLGLAPTTSTFLALALGDIVMSCLAYRKNISAHIYKKFHPGGHLGSTLITLSDIMRTGPSMPTVLPNTLMADAILVMTEKHTGCLIVIDKDNTLKGIVSDGDLRRAMGPDLLNKMVHEIMTSNPISMGPECFLNDAIATMSLKKIHALCVRDPAGKLLGLATWHDCLSYQTKIQKQQRP